MERTAADTMKKAPGKKYLIKGQEIQELQYFQWTHETTLRNVIVEGSKVSYGPAYQSMASDGVYISRGHIYYGTNNGKATCNGRPVTVADIENDPHSQVTPLDSFQAKSPAY